MGEKSIIELTNTEELGLLMAGDRVRANLPDDYHGPVVYVGDGVSHSFARVYQDRGRKWARIYAEAVWAVDAREVVSKGYRIRIKDVPAKGFKQIQRRTKQNG